MTPLLIILWCAAAVSGVPLLHLYPPALVRYGISAVYHHQYSAPLTVSEPLLVLRRGDNGLTTIVTLRNSKDSAFLLEMLADRLDERAPPVITRLQSVLVEAASDPVFTNSKVSSVLLELRLASEASGVREQELQLRDPGDAIVLEAAPEDAPEDAAQDVPEVFINSKESEELRVLRDESLRDGLTGRQPPTVRGDAVIVEAEEGSDGARQA